MRRLWIKLHLWMAAFLATVLLMIATSGGLYLFGEKGTTDQTNIAVPNNVTIDLSDSSLEASVRDLFQELGIEHDFEYIKRSGTVLVTRPTSRTYYEIEFGTEALSMTRHDLRFTVRLVAWRLLERPAVSNPRCRRFGSAGVCDIGVFLTYGQQITFFMALNTHNLTLDSIIVLSGPAHFT